MLTRFVRATTISLVGVLLLATPIFAYLFRAPVAISENTSVSYSMLPVIWIQNNDWLASNGFMNASANDTRVQTLGGLNKPWMVSDNYTLTAIPVPADSQTNLYFTTGESESPTMDIITGYGGYITIPDNPALELSDNFTIAMTGYIDTSAVGANLTSKSGALQAFISGSGNITASANNTFVSPTGFIDTDSEWLNETLIYDGDVATTSQDRDVPVNTWSSYIQLTIANIFCDSLRFYAIYNAVEINSIDLDAYYDGAWHDVYEGAYADRVWVEKSLPEGRKIVGLVRARFYNDDNVTPQHANFYEFEFASAPSVTATGVASGEHTVSVSANETFYSISIDGIEKDALAFVAALPDNSNDWIIMGNATPYLESYSYSVNAIELLKYEPATMIIGNNLPDTINSYNGTITWGANPAGVSVDLGSMISSGQAAVGATSAASTSDNLPVVGGATWNQEPDISGALLTNPFRPIVVAISDNTTLSERQVWVWFGILLLVFITVLVGANVRGHHLITGIAASAVIILLVVWTVFPWFVLTVIVLAIVGGLLSERSPSL